MTTDMDSKTTTMSAAEIHALLDLETQRAKVRGEIRKLEEEDEALSNAIWRRTQFCKELANAR